MKNRHNDVTFSEDGDTVAALAENEPKIIVKSFDDVISQIDDIADKADSIELEIALAKPDFTMIRGTINTYKDIKFNINMRKCIGIAEIEDGIFKNCKNLAKITVPNSVSIIQPYTFSGCIRLMSVAIPDSVTIIGERTFCECCGLKNVTIPESVTDIGEYAFWNCGSLTALTVKATTPPTFGWNMLKNCISLTDIFVPAEAADAYKSANGWKDYGDIIKGKMF